MRTPLAASTMLAAVITARSSAVVSSVISEVSFGNSHWSPRISANPGDLVEVRVRIVYTGLEPVLGLGGLICQPTLDHWHAGRDRLLPLGNDWQSPNGYGRSPPFNFVTPIEQVITSFNDPGDILRFAGSNAATPTLNYAWGLPLTQRTPALAGTDFEPSTNIVTFRYGIILSSDPTPRTLTASVPRAYIQNNRVTWFRTFTGTNSLLDSLTDDSLVSAAIDVIPAPPTFTTLAVLGILAVRRRRDP